jgi:tetratricopeptide (TPR) repeat protein
VLTSAREHGWPDVEAVALYNLGYLVQQLGQMGEAAEFFQGALEGYRRIGSEVGQCSTLSSLGSVHHVRGQLVEAEAYLTEAVDRAERLGAVGLGAQTRQLLGEVHAATDRAASASDHIHAALDRYRRVGNRHGEASALNALAQVDALNRLGAVSLGRRDAGAAADWHRQARDLAATLRQRYPEVEALIGLAGAEAAGGDVAPALATTRRAIERARRYGFRALEATALSLRTTLRHP